ncbi:MAG: ABC transporter ATP-binding protein [Leptospirales bacterium]|nr:ABC transporter ATP-binding protein [Leptospirales bacterium]
MKLELVEVEKIFATRQGENRALTPVSFEVGSGEFVSIIGPSGCGKSTILNVVAGLDNATSGKVILDGREIHGPSSDRGMVFQHYTLFPWLNVLDNVCFGQRLKAQKRSADATFIQTQRAINLLNLMGLKDFHNSYPRELSGGMKQRVAIARALLNSPRVLLMDEPFGSLDAQTREEMQVLLCFLSQHEKSTILFVTHDVEEAIFLSTRIIVISARPGRILDQIQVPFPPERGLDIKLSMEFLKLKARIVRMLHQETVLNKDALLKNLLSQETPGLPHSLA